MRKMKRLLAAGLATIMACSMLTGCGSGSSDKKASSDKDSSKGSVYYLNFKPEADEQWQELAKEYTDETGVPVTVVTAAANQYETTLKSEMGKSEAPTLFQVNGPVGLASWKDYCYDLTGSDILNELTSDKFELKNGDEIAGVGYCTETYGLIYNKALLKKAGYTQDDIKSFADLKKVAEDITKRKDELGFSAFTSAGMDGSSDWRFKTHLANLPIYYEYQKDGITDTKAIKGTYLDNYRNIWDLYINNGTCDAKQLSKKTGDDAVAEFTTEQAVFYQNGTWAYNDIINAGVLTDDDLGMMPIYIGVDGEENQGLCTGSENYWCINANASEENIKATEDFLNWVITSDTGRDVVANQMGFTTPFDTFDDGYQASNAFMDAVNQSIADGKNSVAWCFTTMPSEAWKDGVGSALTAYAAGTGSWDDVVTAFVDGWASEYAAANE